MYSCLPPTPTVLITTSSRFAGCLAAEPADRADHSAPAKQPPSRGTDDLRLALAAGSLAVRVIFEEFVIPLPPSRRNARQGLFDSSPVTGEAQRSLPLTSTRLPAGNFATCPAGVVLVARIWAMSLRDDRQLHNRNAALEHQQDADQHQRSHHLAPPPVRRSPTIILLQVSVEEDGFRARATLITECRPSASCSVPAGSLPKNDATDARPST